MVTLTPRSSAAAGTRAGRGPCPPPTSHPRHRRSAKRAAGGRPPAGDFGLPTKADPLPTPDATPAWLADRGSQTPRREKFVAYKLYAYWSAPKPEDVEAFEQYYAETHVPRAAAVPN